MRGMFNIRLTVESMRQAIMHVFNIEQIREDVDKSIESELKEIDFDALVRQALDDLVNDFVKQSVKSYFFFGEGRKLLKQRIMTLLNESVQDKEE